jgi:hypothetical protein
VELATTSTAGIHTSYIPASSLVSILFHCSRSDDDDDDDDINNNNQDNLSSEFNSDLKVSSFEI